MINLLSVSVKICLGVLLYYVCMGAQTYLFNKLPYNLSITGPLLMLALFIWLKRKWIMQTGDKASVLMRICRTSGLMVLSMISCMALYILLTAFITPATADILLSNLYSAWQKPTVHFIQLLNILLAAGMEEMLFRYLILSLLINSRWNRYLAMLACSILFAVVHLQYNYYALSYVIFLGFALSVLYLMFRNIGPAIGVHFAINYRAFMISDSGDAVYMPQSFTALWQDNIVTTIICSLVIIYWIYTQYISSRSAGKQTIVF